MITVPEQRIEELTQELYKIKDERDRLNKESLRWAEERNLLHEEIKKLRSEARLFKEKRDALNNEVQSLKILREEDRRKHRENIDQLQKLRQRMREAIAKREPIRDALSLEREIETIDWKIQTNPLSLDEERELVERVKILENQLEVYRSIKGIKDEIARLKNEAKALKEEIASHGEKILEVAGQSQKFHLNMIEHLENIKKLGVKADEMHKKYVENKEEAQTFQSKYAEIFNQIKALQKAIQEKEEEEKTKQLAELRNKLEKEALDKLKRGKKLSFEEFKILAEQGRI